MAPEVCNFSLLLEALSLQVLGGLFPFQNVAGICFMLGMQLSQLSLHTTTRFSSTNILEIKMTTWLACYNIMHIPLPTCEATDASMKTTELLTTSSA